MPAQRRFAGRLKRNVAKSGTSADADAVIAQSLAHAPVASETYDRWVRRVFRGQLSGFDLKLARCIFDLLGKATAVRTGAAEALQKMARTRAAETGASFEQAFTAVSRTPVGGQLYELSKAKIIPPALPPSDIAKRAADELQEMAKRIATEEHCSDAQAFSRAAQRFPEMYAKSRNHAR